MARFGIDFGQVRFVLDVQFEARVRLVGPSRTRIRFAQNRYLGCFVIMNQQRVRTRTLEGSSTVLSCSTRQDYPRRMS